MAEGPRAVRIRKDQVGSYGFNLRRHPKQSAGQFVRSVDYEGAAHRAGLRAGDRILAVNEQVCEHDDHDAVRDLIVACGEAVLLYVQHDAALEDLGKRTTARLLHQRSHLVLEAATGIPILTAEMKEAPLGRTRSLATELERQSDLAAGPGQGSSASVALEGPALPLQPDSVLATDTLAAPEESNQPNQPTLTTQLEGTLLPAGVTAPSACTTEEQASLSPQRPAVLPPASTSPLAAVPRSPISPGGKRVRAGSTHSLREALLSGVPTGPLLADRAAEETFGWSPPGSQPDSPSPNRPAPSLLGPGSALSPRMRRLSLDLVGECIALASYAARDDSELSFAAGDMLVVLQQRGDWCVGCREPPDPPAGAEFDDIITQHGRFPACLVERFGMDF